MLQPKNHIIRYTVLSIKGKTLKEGWMLVKNKLTDVEAKAGLEINLKERFPDFGKLVIWECREQNPLEELLKINL